MHFFFSLQSDVILAALSIAMLLAGATCLSVSREKSVSRPMPSWRYLGVAIIILAARDWLGVIAVSSPAYGSYFAVCAILQAVACIPLLMAARIEAPDHPRRARIIRVTAGIVLAIILGILIEPFFAYRYYVEAGHSFVSYTLFTLVKVFFCLTALILLYCTAKSETPPGRHIMSILGLFCLYCFIVSICRPPGLPPVAELRESSDAAMTLLYLARIGVAYVLAALFWSVYTRFVGVMGKIRWWPQSFTLFILAVGFSFILITQYNYRSVVSVNVLASARNAANAIPPGVLREMAAKPGLANDPVNAKRLFRTARKLDFFTGYGNIESTVDALTVNANGGITPILDVTQHPQGGRWATIPGLPEKLWKKTLERGDTVDGLYSSSLRDVIALSPILDQSDTPVGAAVLTVSGTDLVRDLYLFKRLKLLFLPLAVSVLLLLIRGQQRAWLSAHSSNRAEAMRMGALGNDLTGVMITRGDIIVDVNQRACDIAGMTAEQMLGGSAAELFGTAGGLNPAEVSMLMTDGNTSFETTIAKPNGARTHILVFGHKSGEDPMDNHVTWESVDVTRIKNMENELRETTSYLQMIIDSLPVAAFVKSPDGRFLMANQTLASALGRESVEEVVGKTMLEIRPSAAEDSRIHDEICVDMRGATLVYDTAFDIDGEKRFFEISKALKWKTDDEDNYVIVGCMHDFTSRKKVEDAIRSERHFLLQLINTLPVTVCFVDRERVIRLCDQEFCREAGEDNPEDLIGRPYDDVAPFGTPDTAEDIRMLERGGGYSDKEFELNKDGRRRNFILRRIVMSSEDGRVLGLVKAFWDTTALVAANQAAKIADRAKSAFLSNMSHELRTPMNGIVGMADLIIEHESTEPVQRLYAETVVKSAKTLQMVIDEVMDIATLDDVTKRFAIASAPFPLLTLTEEAAEIVSCIVGAWGIDLYLSYDFSLAPLYSGDARRLRQILVQVLTHCSRLAADKRLSLRVEHGSGTGEKDRVVFRTSFRPNDTTGPADLEALFKRQPNTSGQEDERDKSGTSLGMFNDRIGLPLAWRLIRAMGGELEVSGGKNEIDCVVSLPLRRDSGTDSAPRPPDLTGMRVLMAVSDPGLSEAARDCLRYAGGSVDVVGDESCMRRLLREAAPTGGYQMALMDARFLPQEKFTAFLHDLANDHSLGRPSLALFVTGREVQDISGINGKNVDTLLLQPLCPSELWYKAERIWGCRTASMSPSETPGTDRVPRKQTRHGRLTRLVKVPANVLLVEDNTVNQMVEMGILKKIGCRTVLAKNGAEAVEKITAGGVYDLILMDCMMPIMDGYEATGRIRMFEKTNPNAKRHTIVALTANSIEGDKEKCLASGMDDYMTKPVTLEMMREAMLKHCPDLITMVDQATSAVSDNN